MARMVNVYTFCGWWQVVVLVLAASLAAPGVQATHVHGAQDYAINVTAADLFNVTADLPFNCAAVVHQVYPNATYPQFLANGTYGGLNGTSLGWPMVNGSFVFPNVTFARNGTVFVFNNTLYRFVVYSGKNVTWSTDPSAPTPGATHGGTNMTVWCQFFNISKPAPIPIRPPTQPLLRLVKSTGGAIYVNATVTDDGGHQPTLVFEYAPLGTTMNAPPVSWEVFANTTHRFPAKGDLLPRRYYAFRAYAFNVAGHSAESEVLYVRTKYASPPSAPTAVNSSSTGGAVRLMWEPPVDKGGVEILSYAVVFGGEYVDLPANARVLVRTHLPANQSWTFNITAVNAVGGVNGIGKALPDAVASTAEHPTLPTPPLDVRVESEDVGVVTIAWTAPFDLGGLPASGYVVERKLAGALGESSPTSWSELATLDGSATSLIVSVRGNTSYLFSVFANTTAGESPRSDIMEYDSVAFVPPSPPPNLRNTSLATGGAVDLAWDVPLDDGSDDVRGYMVEVRMLSVRSSAWSKGWVPLAGQSFQRPWTTRSIRMPLPSNTSAMVRVRAMNRLMGPPSQVINISTSGPSAPNAPRLVRVTGITGGTIALRWLPPLDTGGVALRHYVVKFSVGPDRIASAHEYTRSRSNSVDGYEYTDTWVEYTINGIRSVLPVFCLHAVVLTLHPLQAQHKRVQHHCDCCQ